MEPLFKLRYFKLIEAKSEVTFVQGYDQNIVPKFSVPLVEIFFFLFFRHLR